MSEFSKQDMIKRINEELDIPFVSEGMEVIAISWVVDRIYPAIPDWALPILYNSLDGINDEELKNLEHVLVREVNKRLDIPYVPESLEAQLIGPAIGALLSFAVKGKSLS